MKKRINVVFQGGGVRGIAHVGAWKAIQSNEDIEVAGVGGSSVGSIVASLIAAGYSPGELEAEMRQKPLTTLLTPTNKTVSHILDEIKDLQREIQAALEESKQRFGTIRVGFKFKTLLSKFESLWNTAAEIFASYGIYDTSELIRWLKTLLEKKNIVTIRDLNAHGNPLIERFRILTSDVSHCCYREITEKNESEEVAVVVGQSISIPIFFKPFKVGESHYVDGGMLSNYPLWLFQEEDDPTVGIRLRSDQDEKRSYPIDNFFNYLLALLWTMVGAHDTFRGVPRGCYKLDVGTKEISAIDFDLDDSKIKNLLYQGELSAKSFDWKQIDTKRKSTFKEANPGDLLDEMIESAREICAFSGGKKDCEFSRYDFTLTIEKDGTAVRHVEQEIKNIGPIPIINSSHSASELKIPMSIREMAFEAVDITPGKSRDQRVKYLPIKNTAEEKSIALFYVPPIYQGEVRTIQVSCKIPERYLSTLLRGKEEVDG